MKKVSCLVVTLLVGVMGVHAQVGIFDGDMDIGEPALPSEPAEFSDGTYVMDAVGSSIGRGSFQDQFKFVYTEVSGSFSIEADPFALAADGEGGLMIRQDLDPDSVHASLLRIGDSIPGGNTNAEFGSVFPHIRTLKGGGTIVDGDYEPGGFTDDNIGPIRLERIGNSIHYYTYNANDEWVFRQTEIVPMGETVYVGLAATANGEEALGQFEFRNVEIVEYPLWVSRSIPIDDFTPGASVQDITLTAQTRDGATVDGFVREVVPGGSTLSNVSASEGTVSVNEDEGVFSWDLSGFSGEATLTYDLVLREGTGASWTGTFSDGENLESYIGNDTVLPKNPTFTPLSEPVELDPDQPVIIQAEHGTLVEDREPTDWGLMVNPLAGDGAMAVNMSGEIEGYLSYPIDIPAGYGDIYLFGHVRGEDGNSDSFFIDIEFEPISDDLTTWDSGGGRSLHFDWVNNRLGEDPRPFIGMSEGENTLYIGPREDSASIDWIAVTNDPNFNIGLLDPISGEIIDLEENDPREGLSGLGIFDAAQDIVNPANPDELGAEGAAGYDPETGTYTVVASGNDIWGTADNFHFMYKELSGDFTIEGDMHLDPFISTNEWAKVGFMAREELESEAVNYMTRQRPDGQFSSQWRLAFGDSSSSTPGENRVNEGWAVFSPIERVGTYRLTREGDNFSTYYEDPATGEWTLVPDGIDGLVPMEDPIYVGLAVTSHEVGSLSIGKFSNVVLQIGDEPVNVQDWALY